MLWFSQVGARKGCQGISNADVHVVVHAAARIGRHRVPVVTGEIQLLLIQVLECQQSQAFQLSGEVEACGEHGMQQTWVRD